MYAIFNKEIRGKTEKNNSLRSALAEEERKNSRLKRDHEILSEKHQKLGEAVRSLEAQVERERQAQRNFNLAERTQRIQAHYSQLRSTMSSYYDQISSAIPLLMLLSNGNNTTLGEIMPLLMGTMGEFNNGESVSYFLQDFRSAGSSKGRPTQEDEGRRFCKDRRQTLERKHEGHQPNLRVVSHLLYRLRRPQRNQSARVQPRLPPQLLVELGQEKRLLSVLQERCKVGSQ